MTISDKAIDTCFRGQRKDNNEWVYGDLIHRKVWSEDVYIIRTEDNGFDNYTEYAVYPDTVGRQTNVPDKNNNLIFEGDLLKLSRFETFPVKCHCGCFVVDYNGVNKPLSLYALVGEIVGTVYDKNKAKDA